MLKFIDGIGHWVGGCIGSSNCLIGMGRALMNIATYNFGWCSAAYLLVITRMFTFDTLFLAHVKLDLSI